MAGDWIPYCKDLESKIEFQTLAELSGLSNAEVLYHLLRFWSWADDQTEDGFIRHASVTLLSRLFVTAPRTFWEHMQKVGWLELRSNGINIPNFDDYMGNSAKRRLNSAKRQRHSRRNRQFLADNVTPLSQQTVTGARQKCDYSTEEYIEEINTPQTPLLQKGGFPVEETLPNTERNPNPETLPRREGVPPGQTAANGQAGQSSAAPQPRRPSPRKTYSSRSRVRIPGIGLHLDERPEVVEGVISHYAATVNPAEIGNATKHIRYLLKNGHTVEELEKAAKNYATHCDREKHPPGNRHTCAVFYRCEFHKWINWVDPQRLPRSSGVPILPELPPGTPPVHEVLKRLREEDEKQSKEGGNS